MKFSKDDYNIRQFQKMVVVIEGFGGTVSDLSGSISSLDGLLNALHFPPKEWFDQFQSEWGGLEEIYADVLYREAQELSEKDKQDAKAVLGKLKRLILQAMEEY